MQSMRALECCPAVKRILVRSPLCGVSTPRSQNVEEYFVPRTQALFADHDIVVRARRRHSTGYWARKAEGILLAIRSHDDILFADPDIVVRAEGILLAIGHATRPHVARYVFQTAYATYPRPLRSEIYDLLKTHRWSWL
eukprot:CAMPEP_0173121562 /NCGR_PEP_ID=MMETSP1102-20130122/53399_1 /TAXON_ID=49646 /ORGANISM="Geminigera sp., Strain Caron Lab Isolate" /LENGTH=138 /DNA_ID=CAMNT_0014028271 /DNA_START=29 /DNA_END=448 /DNA_ORIENTATION=-